MKINSTVSLFVLFSCYMTSHIVYTLNRHLVKQGEKINWCDEAYTRWLIEHSRRSRVTWSTDLNWKMKSALKREKKNERRSYGSRVRGIYTLKIFGNIGEKEHVQYSVSRFPGVQKTRVRRNRIDTLLLWLNPTKRSTLFGGQTVIHGELLESNFDEITNPLATYYGMWTGARMAIYS